MSQTARPQQSPGSGRATPGPNSYVTLASGPAFRHEITIKRSRFITVLGRVEDESSAQDLVAGLRREFHGARHHCSAMVIGAGREVQRSQDDGEPAGTAGIPMLEALLKRQTSPASSPAGAATELSDVCAVVVRYFGGILLGAGGLMRAYSESVGTAVDLAPLIRRQRLKLFSVAVPHAEAGRLENELRGAGYVMTGNGYDAVQTHLGLALADDDAAIAAAVDQLAALTAGRCALVDAVRDGEGTIWIDAPIQRGRQEPPVR